LQSPSIPRASAISSQRKPIVDVAPTALDTSQAGAYLGISRVQIYRLMRKGELRSFHIGKCTRILRSELDLYVMRQMAAEAS